MTKDIAVHTCWITGHVRPQRESLVETVSTLAVTPVFLEGVIT